tara:strand:- start:855 stop:1001 length:147 start_codon:yes stop_codon:yes gene_type:complete
MKVFLVIVGMLMSIKGFTQQASRHKDSTESYPYYLPFLGKKAYEKGYN